MKLAVYTLCYNEEFMLPFFMQHYRPVADKIVIYDNESTDNSVEVALSLGADEVRSFNTGDQIRDDITREIRNNCWKELKGQNYDWVAVVDMDEFLYAENLSDYLMHKANAGYSLCVPQGYNMHGEALPIQGIPLIEQIRVGTIAEQYSKPLLFNPNKLKDINFIHGSHSARPSGIVKVSADGKLKLLHYYWLSLDWVISKYARNSARLSDINKRHKWGLFYQMGPEALAAMNDNIKKHLFDVISHIEPQPNRRAIRKREKRTRS